MYAHTIETGRLILRPLTHDDAEAIFVWCSDPKVNRFMGYPLYTDVAQVHEWLARMETDESILLWGFERKADGLLIGSGSIGWKAEFAAMNIGYNLRSDCWGQGYGTEAARAILQAGRQLGYQDFIACHALENIASQRVIDRCGFTFHHMGEYSKYDGSEVFSARYYTLHID